MTPDKLGSAAFEEKKPASARITTRLALSAPAGLGVLLLAGAIAFVTTSGLLRPAPSGETGSAAGEVDATAAPTPKPDPTPKVTTTERSTPKLPAAADELALAQRMPKPAPVEVAPEPQPQPQPEPVVYFEPTPQPVPVVVPAPTVLALSANLSDYPGKVVLGWSAFTGGGFEYYKLVRTTDGDATWPASGADELIAAIGNPGETWAKDRPPCGTTVFYRVFAVRHGSYGYEVLAPSNQVSAAMQCPPPPPATVATGLDASVVDGAVHLSWGACASEHVNAYKIVRSQTNPEPMYPENEGTQLIAAIGPGETSYVDTAVGPGQTWTYRVLARADNGGGTYIACQTQAVAVAIP
jgi:outer membrane biosynthesis protein TonB